MPIGQPRISAAVAYDNSSRSHSTITSRCTRGRSNDRRAHPLDVPHAVDFLAHVLRRSSARVLSGPLRAGSKASSPRAVRSHLGAPQRDPRHAGHTMAGNPEQVCNHRPPRGIEAHRMLENLDEGVMDDVFRRLPAIAHRQAEAQQGGAMALIQLLAAAASPRRSRETRSASSAVRAVMGVWAGLPVGSCLTLQPAGGKVPLGAGSCTTPALRQVAVASWAWEGRRRRHGRNAKPASPVLPDRRRNRSASPIREEGGSPAVGVADALGGACLFHEYVRASGD